MGTEYLFNEDADKWQGIVSLSRLPPEFENMAGPWRVTNIGKGEIINKILGHSLKVQSSSVRGFPVLRSFILSNACLHVNSLLHHYLSYFDVQSEVHCGGFRVSDDLDGIVHVFLSIDGQIVDNTYIHASEASVGSQESFQEFFQMWPDLKTLERYDRVPPSRTRLHLQGDSRSGPEFEFMELSCRSQLNRKKATAQAMSDRNHGAGIHVYDKLMRFYIREEFGVEVPSTAEEMKNVCWNCGDSFKQEKLKTCSKCQVARYCSRDCQTSDWSSGHKLMHQIIKRGDDSYLKRIT